MRRIALVLLLAATAVTLPACRSGGRGGAAPPPALSQSVAPMRFRRMSAMVAAAQADRRRGDAAALRRRSGALSREGLALIQATLPNDVARTDVPRYIEGRAVFGEALKAWVTAVESGGDADLFFALDRVDGALRGWIDAYLGAAPETTV